MRIMITTKQITAQNLVNISNITSNIDIVKTCMLKKNITPLDERWTNPVKQGTLWVSISDTWMIWMTGGCEFKNLKSDQQIGYGCIYIYNYIHIYIYTFKCFGFHLRFPHAKDSSFVIFKVVRPQHVTRMSNFYRQQEIPPHSRSGHQTFANLPKLAPFRSHVADRAMQWYLDASRQGQNNAYGIMGGWW